MTAGDRAGAGPLVEAEGLVRSYGQRAVVDVDRLAVGRGEVLAILGPNGAGKSTLFRILMLLERPDRGRIRLDGREVGPGDAAVRGRMAGVFQKPALFSGTVAENVRYGLRAVGVPRGEWEGRIGRVVRELGVEPLLGAPVHTLSGGEAQRVALARALVLEPDLVLLDEPTAGLDVTVRRGFREELGRAMRQRARSAVLITHDPDDAFELADRIAVMEGGRIVQVGTPEALTLDPATAFIAAFTGAELMLDAVVTATSADTVTVRTGDASLSARRMGDRIEAGEAVHVRYRPEDVILSVTPGDDVSARNRLPVTVRSLSPAGGLVRVALAGPVALVALITRDSADRLGLRPGSEVTALVKTTALHVYPGARSGPILA